MTISILISIIYSATEPIIQPVVIKKDGYCVAHPNSLIKISINSLEDSCVVQKDSIVFYREYTRKTMKDMDVIFEKNSNLIYFTPKTNALDLSIYNNLRIQPSGDSEILEIINPSSPCNVTIKNIQNIILKNRIFNNNGNNYLKIACDPKNKQCIIKCIASSSIACQNPTTKQQHTIPSGGSFKCILDENNLFWPFNENSPYILKNFTQFQSDSKYTKLELISDEMHASGIYISTCFKNPIKIPSILGEVYQLSTPLENEIQIIYSKNAKKVPSSQWIYDYDLTNLPPFQQDIKTYNIMSKIQKCLFNAIENLNTLEMVCSDFLINCRHCNKVDTLLKLLLHLYNNINSIDIKMSEIDKNTKDISRLLQVILYIMDKYKSYLSDSSHKSLMDQSIKSLEELLEKITKKYFPIASAFKTGCRKTIVPCISKDLKKCGIDTIEKEEEKRKKEEEEEEEKRKREEEEEKRKKEEEEKKERKRKEEEKKKKKFFRYYIISGCCIIIGLFILAVVYLLKKKNNAHSINNMDLIMK